jgi:3-oxoacyl-[acyl-carrier protein] reductase
MSGTLEGRRALITGASRGIGQPEEIATAVVFLAGPGASHMTGQTIGLNGGSVMP